jgi:hypothetical protein
MFPHLRTIATRLLAGNKSDHKAALSMLTGYLSCLFPRFPPLMQQLLLSYFPGAILCHWSITHGPSVAIPPHWSVGPHRGISVPDIHNGTPPGMLIDYSSLSPIMNSHSRTAYRILKRENAKKYNRAVNKEIKIGPRSHESCKLAAASSRRIRVSESTEESDPNGAALFHSIGTFPAKRYSTQLVRSSEFAKARLLDRL